MWATFAVSLLLALPTSGDKQVGLYQPLSLHDCLQRTTGGLPQWNNAYTECLSTYLAKVTKSPLPSQLEPTKNVARGTNTEFSTAEKQGAEISTAYSVKRSENLVVDGDSQMKEFQGTFFDLTTGNGGLVENDALNGNGVKHLSETDEDSDVVHETVKHQDDVHVATESSNPNDVTPRDWSTKNENDVITTRDWSHTNGNGVTNTPTKRQENGGTSENVWASVIRKALLDVRKRKYHSLSINRALVALADMLIAREYNRERQRHQAFRQHLSSLGR